MISLDRALVCALQRARVVILILAIPDPREVFRADQDVLRARVASAGPPQPRRHAARGAWRGMLASTIESPSELSKSEGYEAAAMLPAEQHLADGRIEPPWRLRHSDRDAAAATQAGTLYTDGCSATPPPKPHIIMELILTMRDSIDSSSHLCASHSHLCV